MTLSFNFGVIMEMNFVVGFADASMLILVVVVLHKKFRVIFHSSSMKHKELLL